MNVENLEVGRYSQRNKRTEKGKKKKKGRIKVKSEERGRKERTTPQVEITAGLGCILSKQSIMQNKSKAGQNPRNIPQHLNCRNNLHPPRFATLPLEPGSSSGPLFVQTRRRRRRMGEASRDARAVWADDGEPRSRAGAAKRRQHVCWFACAACLRVCGRDDRLVSADVDGR